MISTRLSKWIEAGTLLAAACVMVGAMSSTSLAAEDGKALYTKNCVACHGASGKGDGPASKMLKPSPKPFDTALKGESEADIEKIIKEGGKAVGKAASMPPYGKKLNEEQVKAVVSYIKSFK